MVDFLVVGLRSSIAYNNIVPLFVEDKIRFGYNSVFYYENNMSAAGWWFSNISDYCPPDLVLKKKYIEGYYKRFDERPDCINIDRKDDIPDNYYGLMGVPVSTVRDINRFQFDILGVAHRGVQKYDLWTPYVEGDFKYLRWIIRRRKDG